MRQYAPRIAGVMIWQANWVTSVVMRMGHGARVAITGAWNCTSPYRASLPPYHAALATGEPSALRAMYDAHGNVSTALLVAAAGSGSV